MGEPYKKEYEALLENQDAFAKGPYLDVTDAFEKGKCIAELIEEGILPKSFSKINMNMTRPLYLHQEKAIRKVATENRNLVVSTGTGSGKTESFLIPILRELATEAEAGTLCPGVRALLIYPMNALANDQTERLRSLLSNYPEIKFGVYTGQTKQKDADAIEDYKSLNNGNLPCENELISRDQMIASPPHILITNYAMLEYLMVRPRDSVFFDGEFATHWKFIVFDEAHVYSGSTGIEVSMLFRRLKAKLGNQKITYILTSATLGGKEDNKQVAEFAEKLCSAPFDSSDIVRADRIIPSTSHDISALPIQFYEKIAYAIDMNCPDSEILEIIGKAKEGVLESELYDLIVHDQNYWRIRSLLSSPETVRQVADSMNWTQKQLSDFVSVASLAEKNGGKLFDARYHMFLRATESVFVTLPPDSHVMLHRSTNRYDMATNTSFKVFEAATCSFCAAVYLVGKIENGKLEQYNMSDDISTKELFLLADSINDTDNDHILEDEGIEAEAYRICPYCGSIHKDGAKTHCEHITTSYVKVYRVKFTTERHTLTKCLHCENVNTAGVLRMFFSGQEASTSVIGTALFQELPSYKVTVQKHDADDEFGDDFGFSETIKEKTAKQFIAFSDSRQAAAFYASYLNISYNDILYKRLIVEALKKREASGGLMVPSFVDLLKTVFEKNDIKGRKKQRIEKGTYVDGIIQRIAAYEREDILSFLSRKNVLPKYGFPVDTVEMTVTDAKKGRGYGLQLQRDLSMAISEYAPGSQIVANNNLITSRYIKKIPKIGWKMYSYIQCDECRTLNIKPFAEDEPGKDGITECCQCHKKFTSSPKVFLIPAQGFIADGNMIRKPGLKKPERTYRGEISYVGFNNSVQENTYSIGNAIVSVRSSQNDEMAVLNKSPFYVCENCGYSEVDENQFTGIKKKKHKISSGYPCSNEHLRLFSLGYRFLTDVVRIRFDNYVIEDWEHGLSILYGFLRGACSYLNIEENDISGCLQYEPVDGRPNYSIVVFDNTPGGAGHAKRLDNENALHSILTHTLKMMKGCVCGGEVGDSSCYSCLRSYKNQKYHDLLKRKYVIEFVEQILDERM